MGLLHEAVRKCESACIADALDRVRGNHTRAAALLGITRRGLRLKIKRLDLKVRAYLKGE